MLAQGDHVLGTPLPMTAEELAKDLFELGAPNLAAWEAKDARVLVRKIFQRRLSANLAVARYSPAEVAFFFVPVHLLGSEDPEPRAYVVFERPLGPSKQATRHFFCDTEFTSLLRQKLLVEVASRLMVHLGISVPCGAAGPLRSDRETLCDADIVMASLRSTGTAYRQSVSYPVKLTGDPVQLLSHYSGLHLLWKLHEPDNLSVLRQRVLPAPGAPPVPPGRHIVSVLELGEPVGFLSVHLPTSREAHCELLLVGFYVAEGLRTNQAGIPWLEHALQNLADLLGQYGWEGAFEHRCPAPLDLPAWLNTRWRTVTTSDGLGGITHVSVYTGLYGHPVSA
jgi:hypothetical protein